MRAVIAFVREVVTKWLADDALAQGAALAFYMLFSLAPLLVLAIAVAGLALGNDAVHARVLAEITSAVGPEAARSVEGMIARVRSPAAGIVATIASVFTMLLGASGVFGHLQAVLSRIFEAPPPPGGLKLLARRRLTAFAMVLAVGVLLVCTMLLTTVLDASRERLAWLVPALAPLLPWLDVALSIAVAALAFALVFRMLPNVRLRWRELLLGGLATALLFAVGKTLIGIYLSRSSGASVFGAAASLVLLLLWIYYSAQILFLGAEVTAVLARRRRI
ncbi:MAG TPA: YihY/virulence factor BrkB family protein [Candidatus Limnocylindria bacterium]|nr:YihY/virulence factor BrkB family protein [Candidatus Limnocylindria bacterium]